METGNGNAVTLDWLINGPLFTCPLAQVLNPLFKKINKDIRNEGK